MTTLAELSPSESATLRSVGGERAFRRRLLEMGFVPGTDLTVVRRVPVHNVLEVELRHGRVSLRIDEAGVVTVERQA